MKKKINNIILFLLYGITSGFAFLVVRYGWVYYKTPLFDRPHHPLHQLLKPGGLYGHGLGIIGSAMILLLFLYSARKRHMFGLHKGKMSSWLNVHIFFGLMGPVLITLHTAMKFHGIVAISYFSMLAVMFSGIFGRYIYKQIPRNPAGDALSTEEIAEQDKHLTYLLVENYHVPPQTLREIQKISGAQLAQHQSGFAALWTIFINDLKRPLLFRRLHQSLLQQEMKIPQDVMHRIMKVARQKSLLIRKRAFLNTILRVFHYWHVIHKPFAYVMIIIMFLHITIAIALGYTWIF
ncbi:MAG: hypothetical protein H6696_13105 [Deferribacteres bacterium]|nr:hypothetical protein [candidate division KSB1 bacterium]MCB9502868.1 hypothetical protein [Deferribacteres bacterium]